MQYFVIYLHRKRDSKHREISAFYTSYPFILLFVHCVICETVYWNKRDEKYRKRTKCFPIYFDSRVWRSGGKQQLSDVRFWCEILRDLTIDNGRLGQCNFCSRVCSCLLKYKSPMWMVACIVFRKRNFYRLSENVHITYKVWNDGGVRTWWFTQVCLEILVEISLTTSAYFVKLHKYIRIKNLTSRMKNYFIENKREKEREKRMKNKH